MSAGMEAHEDFSVIRLDGACTLASAGDLKKLLVGGLASGKNLRVDLGGVEEIDLAAMQLLWAAGQEAERAGVGIEVRMTEAAAGAARAAGFERIAGPAGTGDGWPK